SQAEAQLAAAAEESSAAELDLALRTLAAQAAEQGLELPAVRAAKITARTAEVLPADPHTTPIAPFAAGDGPWWVLASSARLLTADQAADVRPPYPGLVTLGASEDALVLINLPHVRVVLLEGEAAHITEICTSLALELGMSPWSKETEIVTVGFGQELTTLLPTSRIAHMRQPMHAVRDLGERLLSAHQMPDEAHQPYLLCATELDADSAWQLAETLDKAGPVPVAVIAPAAGLRQHFPDAEFLNASTPEPQHIDALDAPITLHRLEHAAYQQILTALAVANEPARPAEGAWQKVPPEPEERPAPARPQSTPKAAPTPTGEAATGTPASSETTGVFPALLAASTDPTSLRLVPSPTVETTGADAESAEHPEMPAKPTSPPDVPAPAEDKIANQQAVDLHAPEIRVLGPVEVSKLAATGHGPRLAQLAALLAFKPDRDADTVCRDMDPITPWSRDTLNARMKDLRTNLGTDPEGNPYVPRRTGKDDPYRISPRLPCDWTKFQQLAERGLAHGPHGLSDLELALSLVRGRPFGTHQLAWAEPLQQEMTTKITDVAHTVATLRAAPGPQYDLAAARVAINKGLAVDENAELLYRDWMRIEHAAGNRSGLHTAIARLQIINRTLDVALQPETETLIQSLRSDPGSRRADGH
ncbi:bacterial transcriptional activator domain-containing protein, partial [Streptomyces sp. T-3]|nr:bacterial transcriptional activator domain-containing protein [Streptomyces sp. T-3]